MKILFCGNAPVRADLGASKVLIELAREMECLGWETRVIGPDSLGATPADYPAKLCAFLNDCGDDYDVVDYDHEILPYPRAELPADCLLVARSVLLVHHFRSIPIPGSRRPRAVIGRAVHGRARQRTIRTRIERAQHTIEQADLVNVSNYDDKHELVAAGLPPDKIVVLPFGLTAERRALFDQVASCRTSPPKVGFVGTFDHRKGARDFPTIMRTVCSAVPDVQFKLLGTRGLFRTASEVRRELPTKLWTRLEIYEHFDPQDLPYLLADTTVGIFPSYVEGFGFGVLEMLAASLPVMAYDAPGPPMMLPPDWLVPRGDAKALGEMVVTFLRDDDLLMSGRRRAAALAAEFRWDSIARATGDIYARELVARRRMATQAAGGPGG